MKTVEGEILKNKMNEEFHKVKEIEDTRVILENDNGSVRIAILEKDLGFYYEKMNGGNAK